MLEPAYQADVVIVGAGVAGLSAAHRLTSAGVTTTVLEAAPYVGGRMSTERRYGPAAFLASPAGPYPLLDAVLPPAPPGGLR
ncbi:FAD/NAD(P)-binding protein, partial [Streptomyces sp. NPDC006658]|uniref:FAD/NAD(P)-binding protein n=1 Tax=Streptomyces sp. NPDC006658 TaxID=3156900 RepID=UPI0033FA373D